MPSFSDSIFLFILALLLFGPKKLPVLARELGKWVGEFRRASNEFKMQMEEELRASEQDERRKQIAAMEAAAPLPPPVDEPEHPHLRPLEATSSAEDAVPPKPAHEEAADEGRLTSGLVPSTAPVELATSFSDSAYSHSGNSHSAKGDTTNSDSTEHEITPTGQESLPIATSGELRMMPPATGLPTPRSRSGSPAEAGGNGALSTLVDSIPHQEPVNGSGAPQDRESATHGH